MKKLLIVILILAVIVLGALLAIKVMDKENDRLVVDAGEDDSSMTVVLEDKKEPPKSKYAGNKRTLAVMIDNVGDAIPQTGLNDAMIVYEAIVEGALTRFMAVYKNINVENIGPSRSARPYFIDYALENDSIFAHYGGSPKALSEIKSLGMEDIDGIAVSTKIYWRTKDKKAPHNAILNVKEAMNYAESRDYRLITGKRNVLNYVVDEVNIEDGTPANSVKIPYQYSKVNYKYNPETKLYERYVGQNVQKDWVTGEILTTKNIIITYANNYTTDEENGYGRQAIQNIGTLDGYYITNGMAKKIKCKKTARSNATVYQDLDGEEIEVNDGNTYIQIVPPSMTITIE